MQSNLGHQRKCNFSGCRSVESPCTELESQAKLPICGRPEAVLVTSGDADEFVGTLGIRIQTTDWVVISEHLDVGGIET